MCIRDREHGSHGQADDETYPDAARAHSRTNPVGTGQNVAHREPDDPLGKEGDDGDGSRVPEASHHPDGEHLEAVRKLVGRRQNQQDGSRADNHLRIIVPVSYTHLKVLAEKIRQPEEEEPPDGVRQEAHEDEAPGLPVSQQFPPRNSCLLYTSAIPAACSLTRTTPSRAFTTPSRTRSTIF